MTREIWRCDTCSQELLMFPGDPMLAGRGYIPENMDDYKKHAALHKARLEVYGWDIFEVKHEDTLNLRVKEED